MTAKTTGAEWKRFYADEIAWPDGAYHEDEELFVDGKLCMPDDDVTQIADTAKLTISGGTVFLREDDTDGPTLEAHFKNWRYQQKTSLFVCETPRGLEETVKNYIRAAGGKVLT